jgi:hypothetical protein
MTLSAIRLRIAAGQATPADALALLGELDRLERENERLRLRVNRMVRSAAIEDVEAKP